MTSLTNYMTVNSDNYGTGRSSIDVETIKDRQAETLLCQVAGIIGISYQIYCLLCC